MAFQIPPPPEGRFGKWAYQLWDYVRANRVGAATHFTGSSPIVVGTGTTGTFTVRHETSGVAAGSYGTSNVIPRFAVDSHGHVTSATNAGTIGTVGFFNSLIIAGDALGTTTTSTLTAALSTTGVAAGTFGAAMVTNQLVIDAKGRVSSAANAGTLGTFASFSSLVAAGAITGTTTTGTLTTAQTLVIAGDALSTSATGTLTAALSTTGVTAGTYGNSTAVSQVTVDAKGRLSVAGNVNIAFPTPRALEASAPIAIATAAGTYTVSHNTSGVPAGTFGAAMVTSQLVVDAKGHITGGTNVGTLGTFASFASLVAAGVAIGTTTTGTLTTARNWSQVGAGDVLGTSATDTFTGALSTTGVPAGTYGAAMVTSQLVVDAKGRLTNSTNAGTLGTMASFASYALAGVVLGTSTTGTLTTAQNFLMGSSVVQGNVPVAGTALTSTLSFVDTAGTAANSTWTLMNWSVPANALAGSAQALRVTAWGTANVVRAFQLLFGGGTVFSTAAASTAVTWNLQADIIAMSSGTQRYRSRFDMYIAGVLSSNQQQGTLAIGVSTAAPLMIFGTGVGITTMVQHGALIDVRN